MLEEEEGRAYIEVKIWRASSHSQTTTMPGIPNMFYYVYDSFVLGKSERF